MKTLPTQWVATKLADHLREPIRNGYSPRCPENPTGTWILSLAAVTHSGFDKTGIKPAPLGDEKVAKNLLSAGDIVVSRSNTPDRVGLAGIYEGNPTPCSYPDLLMRVRLTENLDPKFLLAHLLSDAGRRFFTENARGSSGSMVKIDRSILESFSIPTPPIEEQRAIASALSDMDALLAKLDQLIAKKRDIKQAAMQELLTGRRRLPGFSGEWQKINLGKLGEFLKGRGIKKDEVISEGLPCIRYGEIYTTHNDFIRRFRSYISPETASESQRIQQGDLLFAASGETSEDIGKCVVYTQSEEAYAGGDIVILRNHRQDPIYMGYLMNQKEVVDQKSKMGQGDAVVHISATSLSAVEVRLPPLAEQEAMSEMFNDMDTEITALEARREKTRLLKQGMMQELLSGRVRLI